MAKGMAHDWGHPRGGPWWRFVPWSTGMGYVSLAVGFVLLAESLSSLLRGYGNSAFGTVVEVVLAAIALMMIVQSVDGLQVLWQRRHRERRN